MSIQETTDVAVCDSKAILPRPTFRLQPRLWSHSPRNFGWLELEPKTKNFTWWAGAGALSSISTALVTTYWLRIIALYS